MKCYSVKRKPNKKIIKEFPILENEIIKQRYYKGKDKDERISTIEVGLDFLVELLRHYGL